MFKFRPHRGAYTDSMNEVTELECRDALIQQLKTESWVTTNVSLNDIECAYYAYDKRNQWDTYLITLVGWGVIGYTDQDITEE